MEGPRSRGAAVATTGGDTVHDDDDRSWPPARRHRVTVDLGRVGLAVTGPDERPRRVPVAAHREDVVRRLLDRGLSPSCLATLLPELRHVIDAQTGT